MTRALPLSGWTLVSLRPRNQHAAVRRAAHARGAQVIAASAYKLAALPDNGDLEQLLDCPIRIASSPNAVRYAARHKPLPGHWLAVGNATAGALLRAGAGSVHVAEPQTADGLLNLDILQSVRGRRIGLLTAPDGRGLLERALPERGARLVIANSYQRLPVKMGAATRQRIAAAGPATAVLVTSQRAFQRFFAQFDDAAQQALKSRICIASSTRLLEYLQAQGFVRVLQSRSTLPQDTLQALADAIAGDRPQRNIR